MLMLEKKLLLESQLVKDYGITAPWVLLFPRASQK